MPRGHEILNFDRLPLGHHYYTHFLSDLCLSDARRTINLLSYSGDLIMLRPLCVHPSMRPIFVFAFRCSLYASMR